jgi:3-oxoacyl-[acyl-carrier protein] reductase
VRAHQRVGDAVTDAALFLASASASRITGQTLRIS